MDIQKRIFNATTIEEINTIKSEFNRLCEIRVEKLNLLNRISEISSFGELKTIFEAIAPSLFASAYGRNCIKKFVNTINENKTLQTMYLLNENIAHCSYDGDKKAFLTESLSLAKEINKKDFLKGIVALQENLIRGVAILTTEDIKAINNAINEINLNKEMSETLDNLALNPKRMSNLLEFNQAIDKLVPFMETIAKSRNDNKILGESVEDILKRINEEESKDNIELFKNLFEAEDKESIFEEYKDNCIRAIRKAIRENKSDDVISNKLSNILEKVENKKYNIESYGADIASFMELENVVNE